MEKGGGKGRRRNLFYLKREGGRGREKGKGEGEGRKGKREGEGRKRESLKREGGRGREKEADPPRQADLDAKDLSGRATPVALPNRPAERPPGRGGMKKRRRERGGRRGGRKGFLFLTFQRPALLCIPPFLLPSPPLHLSDTPPPHPPPCEWVDPLSRT